MLYDVFLQEKKQIICDIVKFNSYHACNNNNMNCISRIHFSRCDPLKKCFDLWLILYFHTNKITVVHEVGAGNSIPPPPPPVFQKYEFDQTS